MKFKFKIQDFQTEAVKSVLDVFEGQPYQSKVSYTRDLGIRQPQNKQLDMFQREQQLAEEEVAVTIEYVGENIQMEEEETGFENARIVLNDEALLNNIRQIQARNNIKEAESLVKELGRCSLDIEMETGTGKTYVYIKTLFELNAKYGFSKFIIVVPSVAIREGVKKSFEVMGEHFMEHYKKKARFFIYNSKNLTELDYFSSSAKINVMIINAQAFNTRGKDARRIYDEIDSFNSRKPIDVIAANRPILILDEPQKLSGKATQESLQLFNPLFSINYSATHTKQHNLVYVLDALDAYNKKLVKKIEVKGFEVKNLGGTKGYLYLDDIIISSKHLPKAKIEFEISRNAGIGKTSSTFEIGDSIYPVANLEQYKQGYVITDIDPLNGVVKLQNGITLSREEVIGSEEEQDLRRVQIRETIASHFEKEEKLFNMGIKTLSLFFIDEVGKYRVYDEGGIEINSEYGKIFEEEYLDILNEYITLEETPYIRYLKGIEVKDTHRGYFSIDKKSKRMVDPSAKGKSGESDDISAYDLIMKSKERLLSFSEPTRFIFSHSALREGWDNPNIFQICTLKHSDSTTQKRQEVGRGLRLCVNQDGDRIDSSCPGIDVHTINKLTVIASESYKKFSEELQSSIKKELYDRPIKADEQYFIGKVIPTDGEPITLTDKEASQIYMYLIKNDYIDEEKNVTPIYREAIKNGNVAELPLNLQNISEGVHKIIKGIFDESILKDLVEDASKPKIKKNGLNDNFYKKEFQTLWKHINHKYAYTVSFDSEELIKKCISTINQEMFVSQLKYTVTQGEQRDELNRNELERGDSFNQSKTRTERLKRPVGSQVEYDLVGKVTEGATLTRKTVTTILKGIEPKKFGMFIANPEEFIKKAIRLIKEQKATMIVNHVTYNEIEGNYDNEIFTADKPQVEFVKAFKAKKHIQDYVFTDGVAEKSIERQFAEDLDQANEVCVYAKLPKGFHIPTPVGNYSPDWAIAFNEGSVKHIYFIAETKGSMSSMQMRKIENAKIACAKKLFNELSTSQVKYHEVDSYQKLLDVMEKL